MYIQRYPVPVGKELLIGYDRNNNCDVIGFVERRDTKQVKFADSLYQEYTDSTCKSCELYFRQNDYKTKYQETYKNLFLAHPDMCVDMLNDIGLDKIFNDFFSWEIRKSIWFVYAYKQLISTEYFIQGLLKWNEYENFVQLLVKSYRFSCEILDKVSTYIYQQYDKCKGYVVEGLCKRQLDIFQTKKVPCNHNTLFFLQSLEDTDRFYIYDNYHEAPLSLPNIYDDAMVCWGNNRTPDNLPEAHSTWWSSPFNTDLLLANSGSSAVEMIEGYGFDASDFFPYDEDDESTDYSDDPRSFTIDELISIIRRGGDNSEKGSMDLQHVQFNIDGVKEILMVEDGRLIPDFAEIISENFLRFLDNYDTLFIFLLNEIEKNVWEAYLPIDENEGEYIQINLQDLCNLDLDNIEETVDDDND